MVDHIAFVGVGLIGGSLALALKQSGYCRQTTGYARNRANLELAKKMGALDHLAENVAYAVKDADIIVLAVPLGAMEGVFAEICKTAKPDAIITDVGSAKGVVVNLARRIMPERLAYLVPAHPIAGKEHSGVVHAEAGLFADHYTILTPIPETDKEVLQRIVAMWEVTAAKVVCMDVEHHDQVLAATSHLPHLLAYLLVHMLTKLETEREIFRFAAGGFYDFTRIASSSPEMWRDICLHNQKPILDMLKTFRSEVDSLIDILQSGNGEGLHELFEGAKRRRDQLIAEKDAEKH
ncbi:MAG: prephenate dehydrogenase/arogenate dehydrogenase family protein [Gammaproteobacteria bacterium]|nr:MAG: prephenate dehydrogenase/arogenate dehydrogenase family protein [Gammaproteobacteria bacterium]